MIIPRIGVAISLYKEAFFMFDSAAVNLSHDSDWLYHHHVHPLLNYKEIRRKQNYLVMCYQDEDLDISIKSNDCGHGACSQLS